MPRLPVVALLSAAGLLPAASSSDWVLKSGSNEYRLNRDKAPTLAYFGPTSSVETPAFGYDLAGIAEGQPLTPDNLELISYSSAPDKLRLVYRHKLLRLRIKAAYTSWGYTGTFTATLKVIKRGELAV